MRLAIVGDIHANAGALRGALAQIDRQGCDQLILIGDLLTYGVDVEETLELVATRISRGRAMLLRGNHDALYDDLLAGQKTGYFSRLPDWIRDSVEWTQARLSPALWSQLRFHDEVVQQNLLLSHANPFGAGRWDYLNTEEEHLAAVAALQGRGFQAGVFGHTHRVKCFQYAGDQGGFFTAASGDLDPKKHYVFNAGSIGQPRDRADPNPYVLWFTDTATPGGWQFSYQRYSYDVDAYLAGIRGSGLAPGSKDKICGFILSPS